jgi:hypothetical protein
MESLIRTQIAVGCGRSVPFSVTAPALLFDANESKIPTPVQNRPSETPDLEPFQRTINSVDYYHCVYELLYRLIESSIALVPTLSPSYGAPIMKRELLLSLTLSMLASTAFALPAADQATPQVKSSHSVFSQTVAEGGNDRLKEKGLITQDGSDRTPQGQTLAADGSDRTPQGQTLAADGSDRTPQGQTLASDGSDRTPQGQTLAEGGGDRVIERNSALS